MENKSENDQSVKSPFVFAEAKPKKTKKDMLFRFWIFQTAVCVLLAGIIYFAYQKEPELFNELKSGFLSLTQRDADIYSRLPFITQKDELNRSAEELTDNSTEEKPFLASGGVDINEKDALSVLSYAVYDSKECPVFPVNGATVSSGFGKRVHPIYNTEGVHSGLDLACPEGTPVFAALDGEVIGAGVGEMSGNYVKLAHKNGTDTLYCHLLKGNVTVGTRVRKGDVIGFVGQTGLATGPHLHFEVSKDGVKYDPQYFLSKAVAITLS